jgi:hypothetical protein
MFYCDFHLPGFPIKLKKEIYLFLKYTIKPAKQTTNNKIVPSAQVRL